MKFIAAATAITVLFLLTRCYAARIWTAGPATADDPDSPETARLIEVLFHEHKVEEYERFEEDYQRLEEMGELAVPALIKALADPRTASVHFERRGYRPHGYSPFDRITGLLEPFAPAEAVRPLESFLRHEDSDFRKQAALALGNIGTSVCIPPVLTALDDTDEYVRSYALNGIDRAITAGRGTPEFLDAVFARMPKLFTSHAAASQLMLKINPDKAVPILLSPEHFTSENERLYDILAALNTGGHKVPHTLLLPLLASQKPLIDDFPHNRIYGEALIAYANNPDAMTEATLRDELRSPAEKVQEAAAEALAILAGVANALAFVFETLNRRGFDKLTTPQQHYYSVLMYDAEVNNGGHSQYFVNPSGEHWKEAVAGLKALGASSRATILQQAGALFGPDGPAVDSDTRLRQFNAMTQQQQTSLSALDSRYYSNDENIEALLSLFAISNREHFGGKR
ncbi:MAG: DUF4375 domain-containing protein [Planctomycetaceae bacterium]